MDVSDIKTYIADVSLLNDAVAKWLKHSTDTVAKWITTNRVRMNHAVTSHGNSIRICEVNVVGVHPTETDHTASMLIIPELMICRLILGFALTAK